jgi:hypothetical protein
MASAWLSSIRTPLLAWQPIDLTNAPVTRGRQVGEEFSGIFALEPAVW